MVETSSLYLHKARSTRHACIIVQHMHASYVTLSAKHRNLCFRLSAIVAEDLPCFDLGFQSLNVEKEEKIDCQLGKISTEKKNARFVHLNEQDRYQLLADAEAEATKVQQLGL